MRRLNTANQYWNLRIRFFVLPAYEISPPSGIEHVDQSTLATCRGADSSERMGNISRQIAQMRHEYVSRPFNESQAAGDPITQFKMWFDEAARSEQPDAEAMTLS